MVNHPAGPLNRGALAAVVYFAVGPADLAGVGHGDFVVRQDKHPGEVHVGHKIGRVEVPVQAVDVLFEEGVLHEGDKDLVVAVIAVLHMAGFCRHSHSLHFEIHHHTVPDRAVSDPVDLDHRAFDRMGLEEEDDARCWARGIVCMALDVP